METFMVMMWTTVLRQRVTADVEVSDNVVGLDCVRLMGRWSAVSVNNMAIFSISTCTLRPGRPSSHTLRWTRPSRPSELLTPTYSPAPLSQPTSFQTPTWLSCLHRHPQTSAASGQPCQTPSPSGRMPPASGVLRPVVCKPASSPPLDWCRPLLVSEPVFPTVSAVSHLCSPGTDNKLALSVWNWIPMTLFFVFLFVNFILQFSRHTRGIFEFDRVPAPPGKSWIFSWKLQDLENPGKISLKVLHFSCGSNEKQAAIL